LDLVVSKRTLNSTPKGHKQLDNANVEPLRLQAIIERPRPTDVTKIRNFFS